MVSMIHLVIQIWLSLCIIELVISSCSTVHAFTTITTTTTTTNFVVQQQQQRPPIPTLQHPSALHATTDDDDSATRTALKDDLLTLLGGKGVSLYTDDSEEDDDDDEFMKDALYVDPITKQALRKRVLPSKQLIIGGGGGGGGMSSQERILKYEYVTTAAAEAAAAETPSSITTKYVGTSDTYINLLEPYKEDSTETEVSVQETISRALLPFVPIPLRTMVMNEVKGTVDEESSSSSTTSTSSTYIPMRDLFTSPTVSYLYERGWRQGFTQAGFPGVDTESIMAYDYLQPALIGAGSSNSNGILVDMSCATGLFTRKFLQRALQDNSSSTTTKPIIRRLIGADYSDAMLREARQRIDNDPTIQELFYNYTTTAAKLGKTHDFTFDLVRLDVGMIPMRDDSIDALHAGAAMHCWPDIDSALSEIYRVLRPNGGRYFATTFLANYFRNTQQLLSSRSDNNQRQQIQEQTFQYFSSEEELRRLLIKAGFSNHQIQIDIVGPSCVIIRCEK